MRAASGFRLYNGVYDYIKPKVMVLIFNVFFEDTYQSPWHPPAISQIMLSGTSSNELIKVFEVVDCFICKHLQFQSASTLKTGKTVRSQELKKL